MVARGEIQEDPSFQRALIKKASKSLSGVLVVTVLTSPCVFSLLSSLLLLCSAIAYDHFFSRQYPCLLASTF